MARRDRTGKRDPPRVAPAPVPAPGVQGAIVVRTGPGTQAEPRGTLSRVGVQPPGVDGAGLDPGPAGRPVMA